MTAGAIAPWPLGMVGALYGWTAVILSLLFVALSVQVGVRTTREGDPMRPEKRLFAYSIVYLFLLFGAVVADHWWPL
jgi:protoheme IX farnesyltransferase